jgi:preprotein translocase subunit SecD
VISSPMVSTAITDGEAVIQGNFTQESATTLAILINTGPYPIPIKIIEASTH